MGKSLAEFAKNNPPYRTGTCWLCGIPKRGEVEQGYVELKLTYSQLSKWLVKEVGYEPAVATRAKIEYHFTRGHHEAKP